MTHLSLFSGIGGIDLAAHWAGFESIGMVEREPFCQKVLAKNFPGVPIFNDITEFDAKPFRGQITLLSGGFPCQDVSQAGLREGITGSRSGLFFQMARIIQECSPRWVLIENVRGLETRGMAEVIKSLAFLRYSCTWLRYSARAMGAPHQRTRVFIVAYPDSINGETWLGNLQDWTESKLNNNGEIHSAHFWDEPYSGVCGMAHGVPKGLDASRIKALGNAVVPQQVYPILKAIAEASRA